MVKCKCAQAMMKNRKRSEACLARLRECTVLSKLIEVVDKVSFASNIIIH